MAPRGPTEAGLVDHLLGHLSDCPELSRASHIVVGFSGGLDSTVLLHLLATLRKQGGIAAGLSALHVHHGLQAGADHWQEHCRLQAASIGVEYRSQRVDVAVGAGSSPEAAAREARYAVFAGHVQAGWVLALAHHADDQVETVLLHLLRGSGPRGLAGMPRQRQLGSGHLCRPLLDISRSLLLDYARQQKLVWIEDPSNADPRFTRNFLRGSIVPALQRQLPALTQGVLRSAGLQAEAEDLLQELAAADLAGAAGERRNQLQLPVLAQWSGPRVRNLLRHWIRGLQEELDGCDVTFQALQQCVEQLIPARDDAVPVIAWGEAGRRLELRRYRDRLYLVKPMPPLPELLHWNPAQVLQLPGVLGTLRCELASGQPPAEGAWPELEVRFRKGGESLQLPGRRTRSLKHLLQDSGVPPWLRPCVPLVYCDGTLLAASDLFVQAAWPARVPEKTARFIWERQHLHCGH